MRLRLGLAVIAGLLLLVLLAPPPVLALPDGEGLPALDDDGDEIGVPPNAHGLVATLPGPDPPLAAPVAVERLARAAARAVTDPAALEALLSRSPPRA